MAHTTHAVIQGVIYSPVLMTVFAKGKNPLTVISSNSIHY